MIPPRAGAFQNRAERSRLREAVAGGGTTVLCQVLTGMGGVGKTQLAADYARQAWTGGAGVELLVWVTAAGRDMVVAAFAQAGADVCGADLADPQAAADTFLAWLQTGRRRWLIVLDDVADPNDLTGLWPPAVAQGRTVVTTRRRDAALSRGGRQLVEVGVFAPDEAAAYLASVLAIDGRTEPAADLAGLAQDVGYLPLALSQAAAYIADADISVGTYRTLLARRARTLEEASPEVLPDDQRQTMAAAWELSVEYADRLRPQGLARPMLELVAFLAPNSTPAAVLTSPPALDHLASNRSTPPAGIETATHTEPVSPVTGDEAAGALRALHRLSLLTTSRSPDGQAGVGRAGSDANGSGRTVHVHQVIQRATRDTLTAGQYDRSARAAADALMAVWPDVERDTAFAHALRACTAALVSYTEEGNGHTQCLYGSDAHPVLYRAGRSLGESGQVTAAMVHFEQLATTARNHLGPDHPDCFTARDSFAHWRGEAGDAAGAAEALGELLDDRLRVLGPDHPGTLSTRGYLAWWQGETGDAARAVEAFAALLDDRRRVLGPDHPSTLATRGSLARWRGVSGDVAGAAEANAELLNDRVRVLGPDHPSTLATRNNLARWRGEAGDAAGAAEANAELLNDQLRVLGPDHPNTLTTRGYLARWQGETGDTAGAVEAFAELLDDMRRVLGPDHPNTLATRARLARWRGVSGDVAGAAEANAELLKDLVRVLGPDHPSTLTTRNDLAYWQNSNGEAQT
ncbi:MAG: tetratricopeptide repeat protein [Streptomyces sp.]|nr:tetratricopeptide repeat protein [Streptomyces sp.]